MKNKLNIIIYNSILVIIFVFTSCFQAERNNPNDPKGTNYGGSTISFNFEGGSVPTVFSQTGTIVQGPDLWNVVSVVIGSSETTMAAQTLASSTTSCISYYENINTSNVTFSWAHVHLAGFGPSFTLKVDGGEVFNAPAFDSGWHVESIDVSYGQHTFEWCFSQSDDAYLYLDDIIFTLSE